MSEEATRKMRSGRHELRSRPARPAVLRTVCIVAFMVVCPSLAQAQAASPRGRSACSENGARFAIGEPYTPDLANRARTAAGAQEMRKIEPGGAYTMDFSPDRLNIEVDRAGVVRGVKCG